MNGPQKCCPHCDAGPAPGRGDAGLSPCWLCRKPMTPAAPWKPLPGARRPLPPAAKASQPADWIEIFAKVAGIAVLALVILPMAIVIAFLAVCMSLIEGKSIPNPLIDVAGGVLAALGHVSLDVALPLVLIVTAGIFLYKSGR